MKNKVTLSLLGLFLLLVTSCSETEVKPEVSAEFAVSALPEFQNTLYPSLIFGLSEFEKQGESIDYFTINVAPSVTSDIKIVIEESKLNFETILTENDVSGSREIIPQIKWKYDDLKTLSQPGNVDMTFVCYSQQDNRELARKNMKLGYRAINEAVFAALIENEAVPLYFMAAAYVNEDSPVIDAFLQEVLQNTNLSGFVGYQAGADEVVNQVEAIFTTLREKGIKYSSITNTSNTNPNILSQYIRFSDEVLDNTQANCADGTVFFCSALKKIDIHPVMVFVPGHVYLGYYTDEAKTNLRLLETTMVGNITADFIDASNANVDSFNSHLEEFNNADYFDNYFIIDIESAREIIKPIGR